MVKVFTRVCITELSSVTSNRKVGQRIRMEDPSPYSVRAMSTLGFELKGQQEELPLEDPQRRP